MMSSLICLGKGLLEKGIGLFCWELLKKLRKITPCRYKATVVVMSIQTIKAKIALLCVAFSIQRQKTKRGVSRPKSHYLKFSIWMHCLWDFDSKFHEKYILVRFLHGFFNKNFDGANFWHWYSCGPVISQNFWELPELDESGLWWIRVPILN